MKTEAAACHLGVFNIFNEYYDQWNTCLITFFYVLAQVIRGVAEEVGVEAFIMVTVCKWGGGGGGVEAFIMVTVCNLMCNHLCPLCLFLTNSFYVGFGHLS